MKVETKYNVGDVRYYLYERKIVKAKISSIFVKLNTKGISEEIYNIQFSSDGLFSTKTVVFDSTQELDKYTATTKEEMINKLFAEV